MLAKNIDVIIKYAYVCLGVIVSGAVSSKSRINREAEASCQEYALAGMFIPNASFPGRPTNELIINVPG